MEGLILCIGPDVLNPCLCVVQHPEDTGYLLIRDEPRGFESVLEHPHGLGDSGGAHRLCRAEPAVLSGDKLSASGPRLLCLLHDFLRRPTRQVIAGQRLLGNAIQTGLNDGHADRLEVVQSAELCHGAQAIQSELRIAYRVHRDSLAVLVVAHLQQGVADDDAVAGAEPGRDPGGVVQTLLQVELCAGVCLLC